MTAMSVGARRVLKSLLPCRHAIQKLGAPPWVDSTCNPPSYRIGQAPGMTRIEPHTGLVHVFKVIHLRNVQA